MQSRRPLVSAIARTLFAIAIAAPALTAQATPRPPTCTAPAQPFAPGVISTSGLNEGRLAFTPSGNTIYWDVNEIPGPPGSDALHTIMTSNRTATGWSTPDVASFSGIGIYADSDAFVSLDGNSLVFSSNRPGGTGPFPSNDLWITYRQANGEWGTPVNLGPNVNSAGNELYGSMDMYGNLYFGSDRYKGQWDIWRSRRLADGTFAPAERLGPGVDHPHLWEFNAEISPDGQTLLYATYGRSDSYGDVDLYVSRVARNGKLGNPVNLGPCINSAAPEFHPTVRWDEGLIYFVRVNETADFMVAPLVLP